MQQNGASRLGEPFPPLPELLNSAEGENPLRKAMASVDLLQALEDVDAEEPAGPSGLDDILLAELGPDADPEIPQAAAAIDRQLLLSRIVKARDAILAEEQQAARTVATVDRSEPASPPPPPAAPLYNGPAYDSEIAPEPRGSGFREALTLRRLALAVSVTALCIGAGWTLRSGELPGFVGSVSASMGAAGDGGARVEALQVESAAPKPAPVVSASVLPVAAEPPSQALAERMAPAEPEAVGPVEEVRIKERLIETHAGGPRSDDPAAQAVPAAEATAVEAPPPAAAPAAHAEPPAQLASVQPVEPASQSAPEPAAEPAAEAEPQVTPRDPAAVETAMAAAALGLADLDSGQRAQLKERLVAGECPSTALASLLGRAPVVATRDLVMNLENGC